jgi:hypothetical protein
MATTRYQAIHLLRNRAIRVPPYFFYFYRIPESVVSSNLGK